MSAEIRGAETEPGQPCRQCGPGYRIGGDGCRHSGREPAASTHSAEILRRAAALMRERAEAAGVGLEPWVAERADDKGVTSVTTVYLSDADAAIFEDRYANLADAEHIASWHPAVALAVADWLDGVANLERYHRADKNEVLAALTVARAYLGARA